MTGAVNAVNAKCRAVLCDLQYGVDVLFAVRVGYR